MSVHSFIQGGGALRILSNELAWVGIPVAGCLGGWYLFRRLRAGRGPAEEP